jgi:hypothetical protein
MAELADALDLGSSAVKGVQVQVLFPAPIYFSFVLRNLDYGGCAPRRPKISYPQDYSSSSPQRFSWIAFTG